MCTLIQYLVFFSFLFVWFFFYCLVGCLSMIVWTHAVFGVLSAGVLYFCICTCSAQLSMFHMKKCSGKRKKRAHSSSSYYHHHHYYYYYYYCCYMLQADD